MTYQPRTAFALGQDEGRTTSQQKNICPPSARTHYHTPPHPLHTHAHSHIHCTTLHCTHAHHAAFYRTLQHTPPTHPAPPHLAFGLLPASSLPPLSQFMFPEPPLCKQTHQWNYQPPQAAPPPQAGTPIHCYTPWQAYSAQDFFTLLCCRTTPPCISRLPLPV